ncbi:MAG: DUF4430 domain-containing protein [Bacteriovoracaceae bacterium]|nr:DUF4430 domain-containing protein [Bacteriovoracaceae bacterium]
MKLFSLFVVVLYFSFSTLAHELSVIGPCLEKPMFLVDVADKFETVGDLTIHTFNKNGIPYLGNERGINVIFNSPIGDASLEVISDTEMRAYGWCFFVNGEVSMEYADETYLNPGDKVEWIYSYALYSKGEWKSMCNPSYKIKSEFICKK